MDRVTPMSSIMGQSSEGFSKVIPGKQFNFPADHLAHDQFRQEWWYLTANLTNEQGEPLGLQWTQFRIALSPNAPSKTGSSWATNQLYMAHSGLTTSEQHWANERWSRGQPQLAGVTPSPLNIKLEDWIWQSQGDNLFPAQLNVQTAEYHYSLQLDSTAPFQLQGEKGYSIKSKDGSVASYYYSQPFIQVSGEITLHGKRQKVSGQAWLDREWSSQFLNKHQQGWDWFAIHLDDGSALMLFQLRTSETAGGHFYSARRMFSDGTGVQIPNEEIQLSATKWQQMDSVTRPIAWQVKIASQQIDIELSALNPNAVMSLSVNYWEGPISVKGSHQGVGYMELTGY
ncbi:lipocalin-like domain-containing protein [Shewanella sp. Isolate11]|uniref:lipocalin-like domain-containing protein n=1 Tax=Shewanella sp. Isolate11 TaxID=2908530 RepID=UPI0031F32179